jgi:hypothetical protein
MARLLNKFFTEMFICQYSHAFHVFRLLNLTLVLLGSLVKNEINYIPKNRTLIFCDFYEFNYDSVLLTASILTTIKNQRPILPF